MISKSDTRDKKQLATQLEEILDKNTGTNQQVIIQFRENQSNVEEIYTAISRNEFHRSSMVNPRDLLPPSVTDMQKIRRASSTKSAAVRKRQQLSSLSSSGTARIAANLGHESQALQAVKGETSKRLKQFTASSYFRDSMDKRWKNSSAKRATHQEFWAAKSIAFDVKRDDLWRLSDDPNNMEIANVFSNRKISLPPIAKVETNQLPLSITDNKTSAWGVEAIGAMSVWGAYGARGQGVKVAVLDTGIDVKHPDLAGKLQVGDYAEFDRDGSTIARAPRDTGRHGTHCAGTIAGGDKSGQWIGVAPDSRLLAGTVLPRGSGSDFQILAGMQWAIDKGADIISMSLGALSFDPRVLDVYTRMVISANQLGIPIVVAVGNDGSQTTGSPGNDYFSYTIGATDYRDRAAGFSGGRTQYIEESQYIDDQYLPLVYSKPDVSAPGVAVLSSVPKGKYESWNGTSMATPHVAGALALLLSGTNIRTMVPRNERAYLLQDLLNGSVEDVGEAGQDHRFGIGRINALKALGYAGELGYI